MRVKLGVRYESSTAVWACDYFLFGMTLHVIPELVQAGVLAVASGPLALDSILDSIAARVVHHMYGDVVQERLVVAENLQALVPSTQVRRRQIYDVLPIRISMASL